MADWATSDVFQWIALIVLWLLLLLHHATHHSRAHGKGDK